MLVLAASVLDGRDADCRGELDPGQWIASLQPPQASPGLAAAPSRGGKGGWVAWSPDQCPLVPRSPVCVPLCVTQLKPLSVLCRSCPATAVSCPGRAGRAGGGGVKGNVKITTRNDLKGFLGPLTPHQWQWLGRQPAPRLIISN